MLSTIAKSEEENRNINYYYANGIPYYWQDDSTSANIIVVTNSSGLAVYSSAINVSATTHTLNVQNLVAGQYSVRLLSATGEVLDTKTLLVQ